MKILLVQPPYNSQTVGGNNFYIPEPLALETIGASVTNHNVKLLDMRLEPNLLETLKQFQPDIVGTTSYTPEVYRAQGILKQVKDFNKEILTVIGGHHATLIPGDFNKEYIFLNNLQSSFFGLVLGVFFGIFPIITTIVNGYILGFVSIKVVSVEGIFVLWRLFPHGIFELPAVFISLGLGLKFGSFMFQKKKFDSLKDYFVNSLRVFFFIVFSF